MTVYRTHEEFISLYYEIKNVYVNEKIPFLSEKEMLCKNEEMLIYSTMKFTSFLRYIIKNNMLNDHLSEFLKENVYLFLSILHFVLNLNFFLIDCFYFRVFFSQKRRKSSKSRINQQNYFY